MEPIFQKVLPLITSSKCSLGQYIFGVIYMMVLVLVLRLYYRGNSIPFYAYLPLILSKRIHSIFVLRLFNDCVAVLFGYLAFNFFINNKVPPTAFPS